MEISDLLFLLEFAYSKLFAIACSLNLCTSYYVVIQLKVLFMISATLFFGYTTNTLASRVAQFPRQSIAILRLNIQQPWSTFCPFLWVPLRNAFCWSSLSDYLLSHLCILVQPSFIWRSFPIKLPVRDKTEKTTWNQCITLAFKPYWRRQLI